MRLGRLVGVVAACLLPVAVHAGGRSWAGSDPWALVAAPTAGPPVVVGSPAAGCISGARALPLDGDGYQVLRPARHRFYGHPATIAFVRRLAREAKARGLGELLIGDMGQPRGGPMPSGHASHQNGLDVDIWLEMPKAPLTAAQRAKPIPVVMVKGRHVDRHVWGSRQARLLELAARSPGVDRIFVNPAIKAELCHTAGADRAWLAKLRPWWGHDEHFHVRMACPAGDPLCRPQRPVPPGDGCGWELFSWLARPVVAVPANRPHHHHRPLPPACKAVLAGAVVTAEAGQ